MATACAGFAWNSRLRMRKGSETPCSVPYSAHARLTRRSSSCPGNCSRGDFGSCNRDGRLCATAPRPPTPRGGKGRRVWPCPGGTRARPSSGPRSQAWGAVPDSGAGSPPPPPLFGARPAGAGGTRDARLADAHELLVPVPAAPKARPSRGSAPSRSSDGGGGGCLAPAPPRDGGGIRSREVRLGGEESIEARISPDIIDRERYHGRQSRFCVGRACFGLDTGPRSLSLRLAHAPSRANIP